MSTLDKGERSILATFPNSQKAKEALEALKAAGYNTTQLDTVSEFPAEPDSHYNSAIAGQAFSLSSLTLNESGGSMGDAGPLMAAHPDASGLAQGETNVSGSYLVTVVTNEQGVEQAVSLLKEYGGEV